MRADIVSEIRAMGVTLSVDGGNLIVRPKAAITDDLRSMIREHKPAILHINRLYLGVDPPLTLESMG